MGCSPIIYMTIGISGSGKSHFAKTFCKVAQAIELNLDNFRKELSGDISDQTVSLKAVNKMNAEMVKYLAGGYNVMLSNTNLSAKNVNDVAKKFSFNDVILFFMEDSDDPQLCKDRITADLANGIDRPNVPDDVVDDQYQRYVAMKNATFEDNVNCRIVSANGSIKTL